MELDADFDDLPVTEEEYNDCIGSIRDAEGVVHVEHPFALSEAIVYLEVGSELPEILFADERYEVERLEFDQLEGEKVVRVRVSTRPLVINEDDDSPEARDAEYSDESLAFLKFQMELFDEVRACDLTRGEDGELRAVCALQNTDDTYMFSDLMDTGGYTIEWAEFGWDEIETISLRFSGEVGMSRDVSDTVDYNKARTRKRAEFRNSEFVSTPCGHTGVPTLVTIGFFDEAENMGKCSINGRKFSSLSVDDTDSPIVRPSDYDGSDDESIPVTMSYGYECDECSTVYIPENEEELLNEHSQPIRTICNGVDIPDTDESFRFVTLGVPYIPSDILELEP